MSNGNVSLTGLNDAESEELHRNLIQGTQFFGMIAALAHLHCRSVVQRQL